MENMKVGKMGQGGVAVAVACDFGKHRFSKKFFAWVVDLGIADFYIPALSDQALLQANETQEMKKVLDSVKKFDAPHCVICWDAPSGMLFLPCRHRNTCNECTVQKGVLSLSSCPSCRAPIHLVLDWKPDESPQKKEEEKKEEGEKGVVLAGEEDKMEVDEVHQNGLEEKEDGEKEGEGENEKGKSKKEEGENGVQEAADQM